VLTPGESVGVYTRRTDRQIDRQTEGRVHGTDALPLAVIKLLKAQSICADVFASRTA